MKAELKTKRYFTCPQCGCYDFEVEHLYQEVWTTAGPWYCDSCGCGFSLNINDGIELTMTQNRKIEQVVQLEIPPQTKPITLYVKGQRFSDQPDPWSQDPPLSNLEYYYEEHTCPINYLHHALEVRLGDDADPHGLARFVDVQECAQGADVKKIAELTAEEDAEKEREA